MVLLLITLNSFVAKLLKKVLEGIRCIEKNKVCFLFLCKLQTTSRNAVELTYRFIRNKHTR